MNDEDRIVEVLKDKLNPLKPMRLCPEGNGLLVRQYNYTDDEIKEIAQEILKNNK